MRPTLSAAIFLCAALAFAAVSTNRWQRVPPRDHARTNPLTANPDAIAAGSLLYRTHCAQCHGPAALGDNRKHPSLRTDRIHQATDGDIEWFLRQGDLAHGMPSWSSLPTSQRWQIIAYLRSLP
jgi:mono/diheme cytochrome c family protein